MLGKNLSEALSDISEGKIQEAADVYRKKKRTRSVWVRVAAAAAMAVLVLTAVFAPWQREGELVTAPGVLKVYAYDVIDGTEIKNVVGNELPDGVECLPSIWNPAMSSSRGLPFSFEVSDDYYAGMTITYDINVNCGRFWYEENMECVELGTSFSLENNRKIYWDSVGVKSAKEAMSEDGGIFADVIIRADEQIVGYALLEIGYSEDPWLYFPAWCETICFPMINGELQNVSEEYVTEQMELCKKKESTYTVEEKIKEYQEYVRGYFVENGQ